MLPYVQGQRAQIIAAARQDVEGVKLNLVIVLAGMQGVEVAAFSASRTAELIGSTHSWAAYIRYCSTSSSAAGIATNY